MDNMLYKVTHENGITMISWFDYVDNELQSTMYIEIYPSDSDDCLERLEYLSHNRYSIDQLPDYLEPEDFSSSNEE